MTGDLHAEANAALDRHDFTEATLSMFRTLIAREPRKVGWWIATARCLIALGRFDEAQRALDGAYAIDPRSGVVASRRSELQRLRRIREHAERLLAESPERLRAEVHDAREKEKRHDFQVEGCRVLAKLDPADAGALCALGGAQRRAKLPRVALDTYRRAEVLADESTMSMVNVGVAAVRRDLGEAAESHRLYESVLASDPDNSRAMLGLAAVHLDEAEHTRSPSAWAAAERLLARLWARHERTPKVQAAYSRLHSLPGGAQGQASLPAA
jgi:cytochrome c-type biogenesis protein CcmH/NrfG